MAVLLQRAGHVVTAASGRQATQERVARYLPGVPVVDAGPAAGAAELVLIAVPDDPLEKLVLSLAKAGAFRRDAWVSHLSGSLGLDALAPARAAGARVLAIHPFMTVPDVESAIERIPGSAMAVTSQDDEGEALGFLLAEDVGAQPFSLADDKRALYHAAAVFASNYVVAAAGIAEDLLREAGVPDPVAVLTPLSRATVENIGRVGPAQALTGPAVRGDVGTVERNLAALREAAPRAVAAYVELCRVALDLAARSGRLSPTDRQRVEEVLARWT